MSSFSNFQALKTANKKPDKIFYCTESSFFPTRHKHESPGQKARRKDDTLYFKKHYTAVYNRENIAVLAMVEGFQMQHSLPREGFPSLDGLIKAYKHLFEPRFRVL